MQSVRKLIYTLTTVLALQSGSAFSQQLQWMPPQAVSTNLTWHYEMDEGPNGTILGLWSAQAPGSEHTGVFVARSQNKGLTWSNGIPIDPDYAQSFKKQAYANILALGNSTWCAFITRDFDFPGTPESKLYVSTDDGLTWNPSPAPVNTYINYNNSHASNHNGLMIGIKNDGPDRIIYKSTDAGGTWQRKYVISQNPPNQKVVHVSGQTWAAILSNSDIVISNDNGETWESVTPNAPLGIYEMSDLNTDHNGTLMAVSAGLTQAPDTNFIVSSMTSSDSGRNWTLNNVFTQTSFPASARSFDSKVASFDNDKWIVAWQYPQEIATPDDDWHAWTATSSDQGISWGTPVQVGQHIDGHGLNSGLKKLELTGTNGTAVLAWEENLTANTLPAGTSREVVVATGVADSNGPTSAANDWQLFY